MSSLNGDALQGEDSGEEFAEFVELLSLQSWLSLLRLETRRDW